MKLAEEPCHPWICKWECWSCVIPALLSSAAAQKRKSKGRDVSVFHCTSEGKLIHCASFKINRHNISNIHHLSFSSQTKLLLLFWVFFCLIVLLPRGSKHEESPMIWFGAEQVNPALWSYAVCQHFAERRSIYCSSRDGFTRSTTLQCCSSFSTFSVWVTTRHLRSSLCSKISLLQWSKTVNNNELSDRIWFTRSYSLAPGSDPAI